MANKPPFSVILCCFILASLVFIPQGIVSRSLQENQEDDNGHSKAGVGRSNPKPASSWAGHNSPPTPPRAGFPAMNAAYCVHEAYRIVCFRRKAGAGESPVENAPPPPPPLPVGQKAQLVTSCVRNEYGTFCSTRKAIMVEDIAPSQVDPPEAP